jgi:hypothetical protein
MRVAYQLARRTLPGHSCKCSRHDFTLAQLFACLVVCEFFGLSYRRTEALLADSPAWLADVGLTRAPDHNTLWRAFDALMPGRRYAGMLDLLADLFAKARPRPPGLFPRSGRQKQPHPSPSSKKRPFTPEKVRRGLGMGILITSCLTRRYIFWPRTLLIPVNRVRSFSGWN